MFVIPKMQHLSGIKVWVEAGCPSSGVLARICVRYKRRYKYTVRRVKRRRHHTIRKKIGSALSSKDNRTFWKEVKSSDTGRSQPTSVVDGYSSDVDVCNTFKLKLSAILKSTKSSFDDSRISDFLSSISSDEISGIRISPTVVSQSSNHLKLASPVLSTFLSDSDFFNICLRHSYMPRSLRDCILVPIPKPHKDPSNSENYRPIALTEQNI